MRLQNSMFQRPVHCFFPTFYALKTWFELSRVNLYGNDLRVNKNHFELAGCSSYWGLELPGVKLQQMYEGSPRKIEFGSRWFELVREVRVSEGSSYRESTVVSDPYVLAVYFWYLVKKINKKPINCQKLNEIIVLIFACWVHCKGTLPDIPAFCSLGLFISSIFRLTGIVAIYGNKTNAFI